MFAGAQARESFRLTDKEATMSTTQAAQIPHPITAGAKMAALHRFFRDCTWKAPSWKEGWGLARPR